MGFDPRRWQTPHRGRPITANVDALLAENEALRQEVWALRQQVERLRGQAAQRVSASTATGLTIERVDRWCQAMARYPAWTALRVGPPGGLRALVEELRRHWWNPALTLEQELDRQAPGLGAELAAALRGPHSRGRWAVRAAFALYGPRAVEWLSEEPLRVVEELAQRVERLERRQGEGRQGEGRRRGTRTANHSQARGRSTSGESSSSSGSGPGTGPGNGPGAGSQTGTGAGAAESPPREPPLDPRRREALRLLGLEPGVTPQAIKRAYWRLAKAHHPDLGGDPEAFHRLDAAYRLLVG
jgi:DnaJ-domain-containing protein 1